MTVACFNASKAKYDNVFPLTYFLLIHFVVNIALEAVAGC